MSTGPKLDGAGAAKMATLETALTQLQHMHGIVERMAVAVRSNEPLTSYGPQLRRAGTPMVGLLKGQFGMISDQAAALMLVASRAGGGDQQRLRGLREGVAQIRQALEIAVAKVREKHALEETPSKG
ncbi:MAG TPA: hypothetical protein VFJ74_10245 [Gemmatimonadaceae bacterium]|nr:hypothetical protein [Gemmatimonadaceae bacterium]